MATKTPNTGEPSPLQKRCNTETDRILTRIAELLASKEPSLTVQRILDGNVRLAFGEGVNAAIFLLHSGYGITHVQDMLIGVFQDVHDRIATTDVHAVAVRSTSTDLALSDGASGGRSHSTSFTDTTALLFEDPEQRGGEAERLVRLAANVAHDAHGQQRDSRGPYTAHLDRVAAIARGHSSLVIATCYLHDVLEDTSVNRAQLIDFGFPETVVRAVVTLTKLTKHRRVGDADESYEAYIQRVIDSDDPIALIVKHADLIDHLQPGCPPKNVAKYQVALRRIAPLVSPFYSGVPTGLPMPHASFLDVRGSDR